MRDDKVVIVGTKNSNFTIKNNHIYSTVLNQTINTKGRKKEINKKKSDKKERKM